MKLEIKHILPYLPHKLMVQYEGIINGKELTKHKKLEPKLEGVFDVIDEWNEWFSKQPREEMGLKISTIKGVVFNKHYTSIRVGRSFGYSKQVFCSNIKPILRPLSDLTKEITHNGQTFVPSAKMITHGFHHSFWYEIDKFDYRYLYSYDLDKLIEWHFDVFKLIENNLAIDVNTL